MMTFDDRDNVVLYAQFLPSWDHIDPLRGYLEVCTKGGRDRTNTDAACIVLQELLENAVKYGDQASSIELEVCMPPTTGPLEIRVTNRADPASLALLRRELQRTRPDSAHNAFASALSRLKTLPEGKSMLGLSRIATVGTVEARIEGDQVVMIVRMT